MFASGLQTVCKRTVKMALLFSCMAESRTRGNIIAGLGTRLKVFQTQEVRDFTSASDIDLELPGRKK